jgi:hypothetical protein
MKQMQARMKQSLDLLGMLLQIKTIWVNGQVDTLDCPAFGNHDSIANTISSKENNDAKFI